MKCLSAFLFISLSSSIAQITPQPCASRPFSEMADTSSLPLLSPELAQRKTAKIRLENGMEILLISDEKAAMSAAAVVVQAGSWNDPA
ncbi:MAG: hypothetical protein HY324_03015, partial [Chlamydiia bacterium]|nr:hypothetical protein [Chlamydiia bacterium]